VKHLVIRGDYFSLKDLDSVCGGYLRELAQQNAAEPASLEIVRDRKGDFGALFRNNSIEGMTHNTLPIATAGDESKRMVQVRFSMSFGGDGGTVLIAVKPQPA
jgi:hypothetical protein